MGTTITFRRGENDPTSGSGLTLAEPAFNTTLKTFHIGLGHGITAAWVGAPISGLSADIAAGITYKTPTLKAVKDYVTDYVTAVNGVLTVNGFAGGVTLNAGTALGLTSSSGNITLTNLGIQSFNGLTGAVGGVTTSVANTFVPMQSFSAGISAAGGTFTQRTVFISGIQSAGITASTVTSEGTSTIPGYPGYASTTTVSPDTIKFVFDGAGGQILRPTDDNIDGSTRTNYLPASSGTLALTSQLMGAVNGSTAATTAVTSFNGRTGAVTGASLGANTFTGLNTFNAGVTTSFLYASTGSTFGSTLQVNGGATFAGRVDVGGILDVVGGTTFESTTDHAGVARFASGVTISGTLNGATATFSRWLSAPMGISAQTITSRGSSLVLSGLTSGAFSSGSQIVLPVADGIQLNGYGGAVALSSAQPGSYNTSLKFMSEDTLNEIFGSVTLTTYSYTEGDYTLYLPNTANGTLALTSQLMGAVNGSTAATTAVTSFNGRTGAVQGVSSAAAGTGISVSAATGAVTITNTGVQSFNGQTGAVSFVNYVASVNGATGAVTNVAKTNEITSFSAASNLLTVTDTTSGNNISINPSTNKIVFYDDNSGNDAQLFVGSFGNQVIALPDSNCTLAGRDISQTFTSENTFTALQTFSAGISAAGCTFSSTTNTLDVIASTEGAGLRIARAASGVGSRIGGIRFGRSTTSSQNTYLEGSSGTFNLYNGVDNTGTLFAAFSTSQFSLGTTSASFISLNCPNTISFGDQSAVGNNQIFAISGTNRTYTFGDPNGTTTGFVGINRSGLCGDYALEVNSPTGKGLQLIYNDHTGAASNWVNMDVSSGGNFTVRPSGGLATVTGTLNVSAGLCAAGGTFSGDIAVNGGDITTTSTTATLYNTTATTVNIGAAATTVSIAGNTAGMTFGMGSYHKFKTNRKTTTSTSQTEIFRFNYVNPLEALIGGNDAAYAEIIITAEQTDGSPGYCSGTQITKILVAATPGDGVVNHVEYGNVNTNGNLATYTASGSLDDVLIYATPVSSATTVFKVFATLIRGEFGVGI